MQLEFYQREAVIFNEVAFVTISFRVTSVQNFISSWMAISVSTLKQVTITYHVERKDGVYKRFYSRYEFVREVAVLH
jgi:hypothetical protein